MIEYDRFKDRKQYVLTMSFDDGDFDEKIIEIFNKYGIKGTFHLNSNKYSKEQYEKLREIYKGHEISCHGTEHRTLGYIPKKSLFEEIYQNRVDLEEIANYPVTGMSYACGWYNDEILDALKNMGIVYGRTAESTENFFLPKDFMKWTPTCHYKKCMEFGKKFLDSMNGWFGFPKLLYIWGHGHEVHYNNHWDMLEEFCKMIGNNDKIWYATNMEIYEYIKAQRNLVISANGKIIHNPTSQKVWFSESGKEYVVNSGETLYI